MDVYKTTKKSKEYQKKAKTLLITPYKSFIYWQDYKKSIFVVL